MANFIKLTVYLLVNQLLLKAVERQAQQPVPIRLAAASTCQHPLDLQVSTRNTRSIKIKASVKKPECPSKITEYRSC